MSYKKYEKVLKKDLRKGLGLKRKDLRKESVFSVLYEHKEEMKEFLNKLQEDFAEQVMIDRDLLFGTRYEK